MKKIDNSYVASCFICIALAYSTAAFSAGTMEDEAPTDDWQTFVQMDLDNGYYESALERLEATQTDHEASSADWNNFMGYTLRKQETPDLVLAETHYKKALTLKADHKGALEYYGELKLTQNDLEGAKALMATLAEACPDGCDELDELKISIEEYAQ